MDKMVRMLFASAVIVSLIQPGTTQAEDSLFDGEIILISGSSESFLARCKDRWSGNDELCCEDDCCDRLRSCCDGLRNCCDKFGNARIFGGAEMTYLSPNYRQDASSATVGTAVAGTTAVGGNLADDWYTAPRVWIGIDSKCTPWFAQVRFWEMQAGDSEGDLLGGNTGSIDMLTFDFEVGAKLFEDRLCKKGDVYMTFGGRYADYNSNNSVSAVIFDGNSYASASSQSMTDFSGTGLTWSLYGNRRIRCSDWFAFFSTRQSLMFGDTRSSAITTASTQSNVGGLGIASSTNGAINDQSATLYVGEIQLGTEWRKELVCVDAEAYLRFGVEMQFWDDNQDGRAGAGSTAQLVGISGATAIANSGPTATNLFGITFGAGVNY